TPRQSVRNGGRPVETSPPRAESTCRRQRQLHRLRPAARWPAGRRASSGWPVRPSGQSLVPLVLRQLLLAAGAHGPHSGRNRTPTAAHLGRNGRKKMTVAPHAVRFVLPWSATCTPTLAAPDRSLPWLCHSS